MSFRRELDRGVITLQAQVRELSADLHELKGETRAWQTAHNLTHVSDQHDRTTGRRWLIGATITGVASMAAALGMLFDILAHVH